MKNYLVIKKDKIELIEDLDILDDVDYTTLYVSERDFCIMEEKDSFNAILEEVDNDVCLIKSLGERVSENTFRNREITGEIEISDIKL